MSGSVSKISRTRAAAVIASWAIARITPSDGHRPDQREHERDERDQLAGRQRAPADADRAEQQHDDDGEVGDHLEEGPEPRRQPDLVHARCRRACWPQPS